MDITIPMNDFSLFLHSSPLEIGYLWLKENVVGFEDSMDDFEAIEPIVINEELTADG